MHGGLLQLLLYRPDGGLDHLFGRQPAVGGIASRGPSPTEAQSFWAVRNEGLFGHASNKKRKKDNYTSGPSGLQPMKILNVDKKDIYWSCLDL